MSPRIGWAAFLAFMACIPLANWMIGHVGTVCVPQGPCLIPVWPGLGGSPLLAPSGVVTVGLALVLRDVVQRCLGVPFGLLAVFLGTLLSMLVADGDLVVASGAAFLLSELVDFVIYTPLQRRGLMRAVVASAAAGLVIDSVVFLWLAFGSLDFLAGQIVGKAWAVVIALPLLRLLRRVPQATA